jgi:guanylate kinase
MNKEGKLLIFSAPSGSGKSTIIKSLFDRGLPLSFSISATSRPPRGKEKNGVEYFFLTEDAFRRKIKEGDFLEYMEVYPGRFYGTLKSQVEQQLAAGQNIVLDVDVCGGMSIKSLYGDKALSIFIQPPSIDELQRRLEKRGTDSPAVISDRIARAKYELSFAPKYDRIIVNDALEDAEREAYDCVSAFLRK